VPSSFVFITQQTTSAVVHDDPAHLVVLASAINWPEKVMKGSGENFGHTWLSGGLLTSVIESQNAPFPVDCFAQQSVSLVSHGSPWQYVAEEKVAKQKVSNIIRPTLFFSFVQSNIFLTVTVTTQSSEETSRSITTYLCQSR
jgi:hypothetical protein